MNEKPSLEKYFELPNPGLRAYFKRTEEGNPDDYRPPFWKGQSRDSVLKAWDQEIGKLGVKEKFPGLMQFEEDMRSKVGPMSIQLPLRDRIESIKNYFDGVKLPSEPLDEVAIGQAIKFFGPAGGIRERSRARTLENMRLSTNAGNPWFAKRRLVANQALNSKVYKSDGVWYLSTPKGTYQLAAILGWRGQEGGISEDDVKQRVIWMMSMGLNLSELQSYQPAIEAIQKRGLIPAYVSMEAVDQEVTALFATKGANDDVICTDFAKFDQHFNRDMQNAARTIERALFTGEHEGLRVFDAKFEVPIICSEDLMFTGPHGMGSGSGGTNFDECMAHKALQFEAALRDKRQLNLHSMAYGDDGCLTYPGITAESVMQTYTRHGQEMQLQKQYVSKHECVVLRRWHGTNYTVNDCMVGVYSTYRALGRLLAQERFYDPEKWNEKMVVLRALSILENCKWSPLFYRFIEFVKQGDKYALGCAIPGFFTNIQKLAKDAIDEFEDFLGYTKQMQQLPVGGIKDWFIVQYLRDGRIIHPEIRV